MIIKAPFYFEKVKRNSFLYALGVRFLLFGRAASGRTSATLIGVNQ